jgi:uncharacterized protein with NRDE domain
MCTLIALWRAVDGHDVVVGMNRDESAMRSADPPTFMDGTPPIVAPRDRKAGGTWLGASGTGLVVALSNRRGKNSETARSRGLLVLDALKLPTIPAVDVFLQREAVAHEYNFWNMLVANRRDLRFFRYDGQVSVMRGHEGLNVLTNDGGNVVTDAKATTVQELLARTPYRNISDAVRTLQSVLRHHGNMGTTSLCLHGTAGGTVSSTIVALNNADPGENILLYADGAPCQTPYRDYHEAIRRLPSPD